MSGSVLDEIAAHARRRVSLAKAAEGLDSLRARLRQAPPQRPFAGAFRGQGLHVIAEIKRASPSEGPLGKDLDPAAVGQDYARAGAAAISVLTEPRYFDGALSHLAAVRAQVAVPLLLKDFLVDEYQLVEGRLAGADCALLIAALLGRTGLARMLEAADAFGIEALVEVHAEEELSDAIAAGARLIGVNNRDLKTLAVDLGVSRRLAASASGKGAVLVCESGLSTRAQLEEMSALGYRAFLIGTAFIKSGRPGEALARLLAGAPR